MKFGFVRRFSAVGLPLIAIVIATRASAATVVTFIVASSDDTLTISNPHDSSVTGHIRLIPDAGTLAPLPLRFSILAQGSQMFPNVLSGFASTTSPAILAVESSDAVRLSDPALRIGYPERPLTLPVRFNPGTPTIGALVLGILHGLVRVNIYEHQTSATPLVSRTFGSSGEQVTRLRYIDLIPASVAISDGYAEVLPLSGQVVGTAVNPPIRRRAAGPAARVPPIVSIAGDPACEFATGIRAFVPPVAGATYRWTLVNATSQGPLTDSTVDLALGGRGYASLVLETRNSGSTSTVETNIEIEGKPAYAGSNASSVTLGEEATIIWVLDGGAPASQTLSGTDFGAVALGPAATSYSYHPTTAGPKTYALTADNNCGTGSTSGEYSISAACSTPRIESFTNSGAVCAGSPVQLSWTTSGSGTVTINNGVGVVPASGSLSVSPSATTAYAITKTAACGSDTAATTVVISQPPRAATLTITPDRIDAGGYGTLNFTIVNPTTSWSLSNPSGNTLSPSGGTGNGSFTSIYSADNQCGPDTVTLTVVGPCGTSKATVNVDVCFPTADVSGGGCAAGGPVEIRADFSLGVPPFTGQWSDGVTFNTSARFITRSVSASGTYTIASFADAKGPGYRTGQAVVTNQAGSASSFTIDRNPVPYSCPTPLRFTLDNVATWSLASARHNCFSQNAGTGSGSFTVNFSACQGTADDVVTLSMTSCGTTTTRTLNVAAVAPSITSFTAPASVPSGSSGTISFTFSGATTYTLSSSLGNSIVPAAGSSTSGGNATYTRDKAAGPDSITLVVANECGSSTFMQRGIN